MGSPNEQINVSFGFRSNAGLIRRIEGEAITVVLPGLCGITVCFCCGAGISPVCDLACNDLRLTVNS